MSNTASSGSTAVVRDELFDTLADARSRAVLRLVDERSPAGIEKDELAVQLAAVIADDRRASVSEDDRRRTLVELHHRLVPRLTEAGLLEETDGVIRTTDHGAFDGAEYDAVLSDDRVIDADALDDTFEALSDERRRTALAVLRDRSHPIATETLARDVAAREAGTAARAVSQERVDRVLASLVHVHLPSLHDATLVAYDDATDRVSYEGHPAVRAEWIRPPDGSATTDATSDASAATAAGTDDRMLERLEAERRGRRSQYPL